MPTILLPTENLFDFLAAIENYWSCLGIEKFGIQLKKRTLTNLEAIKILRREIDPEIYHFFWGVYGRNYVDFNRIPIE